MASMGTSIGCAVGSVTGISGCKSSSSASQNLAQKIQHQQIAKSEGVVDGGVLSSLGAVREAVTREKGKLFFASFVAGLGRVETALALNYNDIVSNAGDAVSNSAESFDLNVDLDTSALTDFIASNPLAIVGGAVAFILPVVATNLFNKKPQNYGTVSATQAYEKLGDSDALTQLIDIRFGDDIKSEGSPDLRSFRKRVTQLPYADDAETFLDKAQVKFKDAENTTLYVLDRFDGSSAAVAKLLATNGFKAAYAIKDGAEGPSGWQTSELPWLTPRKGFKLDLSSLKDVFDTTDSSNLLPATLGVAAAAGVGLVVFSEAETALQLLGSAALVQIFVKKLLFAKDRKKALEDLQTFLDTKVAPKELAAELKGIGKVLLPQYEEVKAATANGAAIVENTVENVAPPVSPEPVVSEPKQAYVEPESPAPGPVEEEVAAAPVEAASTPASIEPETPAAPVEASIEPETPAASPTPAAAVEASIEPETPAAPVEAASTPASVEPETPAAPVEASSAPAESSPEPTADSELVTASATSSTEATDRPSSS